MAKTPKRWYGYPKLYKLQKLADRINNKFTIKQIDEGMYLSAAIGNKVLYRHPASLVQYIKDRKKYLAPPVRKAAEEAMDEARKIDRVVKGASGKAIRRDNPKRKKNSKRTPPPHKMRAFWDTVNRALLEQDFDVNTPKGRCSNLICGGYLQITAHGIQYRSIPDEYTTKWVSWEPFKIIGHFSILTDPNAVVEYIPHRKNGKRKVYKLRETMWPE